MNTRQKEILDRLSRMLNAWEAIHPDATFAGMTLDQFRAAVQPSLDARQQAADAIRQRGIAITLRVQADEVTDELMKRVVGSVRGHEGEHGRMYRDLGYKLPWERKTGRTRQGPDALSEPKAA